MSLLQKIKDDRNAARVLARSEDNRVKSQLLTTLLAEAERPGLDDGKRESTDAEVVAVVKKFIKNIDETLAVTFDPNMTVEREVLIEYLPKQLSEAQLRREVTNYLESNINANMGQIMGFLKKEFNGKYDGKTAATVVKAVLA